MVGLCNLEIVWWCYIIWRLCGGVMEPGVCMVGLCNLEIVWLGYVTWRLYGGVM